MCCAEQADAIEWDWWGQGEEQGPCAPYLGLLTAPQAVQTGILALLPPPDSQGSLPRHLWLQIFLNEAGVAPVLL